MIWGHLRYITRSTLGVNPAGRRITVFPDDTFIVSYPRSGNTWARFLIGNLLHPQTPVTFANLESVIPEIYFFSDRRLRAMARPRVLKSHEYFDPRYKQVIYLLRDPRDVAVSTFYYSLKRGDITDSVSLDEFVPQFIAGQFFADFGTWEEHVKSWHATRHGTSGFATVRYEEMLANPINALRRIATALRVPFTSDTLARAVELSSAGRMRGLEKEQASDWKLIRSTRQDIPFVRDANAGGWKSKLSPFAVTAIEQAWGKTMSELGYPLLTAASTEPALAKV